MAGTNELVIQAIRRVVAAYPRSVEEGLVLFGEEMQGILPAYTVGEGPPVIGTGSKGQFYYDSLTGMLYFHDGAGWSVTSGTPGPQGPPGLDGLDGDDGLPGPAGTSSYTHIAYTNLAEPPWTGFSTSDATDKLYIGMFVNDVQEDSQNPALYRWTLIRGMDGENGLPGPPGDDGLTPYFHTAWATDAAGTGFSTTVSAGKTYLGTYTDYTETDSPDWLDYDWVKIEGPQGPAGTAAQTLTLISTSQAFTYNSGGFAAPSGQSITFTAILQGITNPVSWDCKGYNADKTLYGELYFPGTNLERTLSIASFSTCAYAVITATAEGWTDKITIVRLKDGTNGGDGTDGENAVVGYLTNESVTIAATDTGAVADWGPAGGTFRVYDGLAEQTNTLNVNYVVESATGVSITIGSTNGVYSVSGMSADTGTATLRCIYNGGTVTLRKVYSIAKSKAGPAGTDGTNGTNGTNGERGAGFYTASDTGATAPTNEAFTVLANNATPGGNVFQDRVTIYNNSATPPWSVTKYWDGDTWEPLTQYLDGNLLVSGTVAASAFVADALKTSNYTAGGTEGTDTEYAVSGAKLRRNSGLAQNAPALLVDPNGFKIGNKTFSQRFRTVVRDYFGAAAYLQFNLNPAEPDTDYVVLVQPTGTYGNPVTGQFIIKSVTKATSSVRVDFLVGGNLTDHVKWDIVLVRF